VEREKAFDIMPDMSADTSSLERTVHHSPDVLFQEVGEETVLLDLASESYFGLNEVGARIWQLIGDGATLQSIFDALVAEFDAEPERIRADLLALVDELAKAGLIRAG
jgi:hypothetical protein